MHFCQIFFFRKDDIYSRKKPWAHGIYCEDSPQKDAQIMSDICPDKMLLEVSCASLSK